MRPAIPSGRNGSSESSRSPVPMNLIGTPGDVLDRKDGAAAGVAIQLGHDHAVQLQRVVERAGTVDGVLAGHAVDHQVGLIWLDLPIDPRQLVHQLLVDRQAARRCPGSAR